MSSITFGPAQPCNECRENFMKFLTGAAIGWDLMLLVTVISDAAQGRVSRRAAIAIILIVVLCIALMAYSKGRVHGIRTLADRLNTARRREHEETEEVPEEREPEAATTEESEETE